MVYGVMSDGNPTLILSRLRGEGNGYDKRDAIEEIMRKSVSTKQLSIHSQELYDILVIKKAYRVEDGKELDINGKHHRQ